MDVTQIMQAIGSLGFPIVACCALFYYLSKEQDAHKEEMNSMRDALDRNTTIMTELKEMLKMITGMNRGDQ